MKRYDFTDPLIERFKMFLDAYDRYCPFKRFGQLEYHVETIRRLRALGSAQAATNDIAFLESLYRTLQAWGIGSRGSILKPFPSFVDSLQAKAAEIRALDGLALEQRDLAVTGVAKRLAHLMQTLEIVDNKSRVVPGSKTLHHLLPELVVPVDREYTQRFFGWHNPQFQFSPEACFIEAFHGFVKIARATNPAQYVGEGWYTSPTKVIDNAVVGMWCWARAESGKAVS